MLVLSIKVGEGFCIGQDIHVKCIRNGKNGIRVGITAPRDLHILRDELKQHDDTIEPIIYGDGMERSVM